MDAPERVLITGPVQLSMVESWSAKARSGSVTVLAGEQKTLYEARQNYAEFPNVMASPGNRDDIPWDDAYFTLIVDESPEQPTTEIRRVLAPQGRILALKNFSDSA